MCQSVLFLLFYVYIFFIAVLILFPIPMNKKRFRYATEAGCPVVSPAEEEEHDRMLWRMLVESFPGSLYMLHADGRFAMWSSVVSCIACRSEREVSGSHALDLVHPDDREMLSAKMRKVIESGSGECAEVRILLRGGPRFRWIQLTARRIMIQGRMFLAGNGVDINARKKEQLQLLASERRYRSMMGQLNVPVFITGKSGEVTWISPAFEKMSGYSPEELFGRSFATFIDREGIGNAVAMFNRVMEDHSRIDVREFRLRKKNGEICYAEMQLQYFDDGGSDGAMGLVHDITRRRRFESPASFRLRLLQMVENSSVEDLLRVSLDEAEWVTGSAFGFFDFLKPGSVTSERVWSVRMKEQMAGIGRADKAHPFVGEVLWSEVFQRKSTMKNNDFQASIYEGVPEGHPELSRMLVVPVLEGDSVIAVFVLGNKPVAYDEEDALHVETLVNLVWDIIARKQAEQSERDVQAVLMQVQKMELLGQLAGGIAHDFNNMIGVILGNAELAMTFGNPEPPMKEHLQEIYNAAERSAELTGQLLAFARKQASRSKVVEPGLEIEGMLGILRRLIGESVNIVMLPDQWHDRVMIDPSQLGQVLTNLCVNARDAIDGVGQISIEINRFYLEKAVHDIGTSSPSGDYVVITVSDTGQGISKEDFSHIFEPFFTTKKIGKGIGLGLSMVYGIVRQNHGFIHVESALGEGTTFRIYLPRQNDVVLPGEQKTFMPTPEDGLETVLLVEDEPVILNLCMMMLEKNGYKVLPAESPGVALEIAQTYGNRIDLLLTDVIMPQMNGLDLSNKITAYHPDIRILFMSAYTDEIILGYGGFDHGVHFIQKPFTIASLVQNVRKILKNPQ